MIAIRQKQRQNIRKEGIRNGTAKREKDRNQNFKETITIKLVAAVVGSAVIAVSVLLAVVYDKMSKTLLEKK